MKLDRNLNANGRGKYGLILNRKLAAMTGEDKILTDAALAILTERGIIDWGDTVDTEFFVIRLRDRFAGVALREYSMWARVFARNRGIDGGLTEYLDEISKLADRAGGNHPNPKVPD